MHCKGRLALPRGEAEGEGCSMRLVRMRKLHPLTSRPHRYGVARSPLPLPRGEAEQRLSNSLLTNTGSQHESHRARWQ